MLTARRRFSAACGANAARGSTPSTTPVSRKRVPDFPITTGPAALITATNAIPGCATRPGTSRGQRWSISSRVSRRGPGT